MEVKIVYLPYVPLIQQKNTSLQRQDSLLSGFNGKYYFVLQYEYLPAFSFWSLVAHCSYDSNPALGLWMCTRSMFLWFFFLHWECQSWAVQLACNLPATDQVQLSEKIFGCIRICRDLSRTIIDLGHPSVPTGLVSMVLSATWWALYRSCLLSTWLWKRGFFLTGSSAPNCGETTLSTGVQQSEKTKGLNTDLSKYRWGG